MEFFINGAGAFIHAGYHGKCLVSSDIKNNPTVKEYVWFYRSVLFLLLQVRVNELSQQHRFNLMSAFRILVDFQVKMFLKHFIRRILQKDCCLEEVRPLMPKSLCYQN